MRRVFAVLLPLFLLVGCGQNAAPSAPSAAPSAAETPTVTDPISTQIPTATGPISTPIPPATDPISTPTPTSTLTPTPTPAPTPTPTPSSTPTPTPTPTPIAQPVVPDVCAFLGARKNSNSKHKYNATYEEYEEVALDQYETLKSELTALLGRYALTQISAVKKDITDLTWQYRVDYSYDGEGVEAYSRSGYEGVHVSLLFTGYTQTGELAISYTYVDGLTAVDPVTRTSAALTTGGNSSSGSSASEKDCWYCGGSGTCPTCHGSGTVRKWVAGTVNDYVDQSCTDCYSPGKCRMCGGSGHE